MNFQSLAVVLVVAFSFAYATWTLMPQALRAALARGLLRLPLPAWARARLAAPSASGCGGCAGCSRAPNPAASNAAPGVVQRLVFQPRKPHDCSTAHTVLSVH